MNLVKRHPVVFFFALAYILSWAVWGTSVAQARGLLAFHIPNTFAFVGVAMAAYVTVAFSGGYSAVKDLFTRLVRWRTNPLWYAIALLLTAATGFLAIAVYALLGGAASVGKEASLPGSLLYLLTNFPLMWLTEETAWRGFAQPRLQKRWSALTAAAVIGVLWAFWHLPLFLIPGSFQSNLPFAGFLLSAVATSIWLAWVFNHAAGSVLLAGLMHSAVDASIVFTGVMSSGATLLWLFVAAQWLVVLGMVAAEGRAWWVSNPVPGGVLHEA